jgi:hypothetical protein
MKVKEFWEKHKEDVFVVGGGLIVFGVSYVLTKKKAQKLYGSQ